jgi:hypothetical protein
MCPHTTTLHILMYVSSYSYHYLHILMYMCPHTIYVSSYCYMSSYYYISVRILLYLCPRTTTLHILMYMCPHNTIYVSSYCYMCPHTNACVSSYYYICVLILLHMCPHPCVSFLRLLYRLCTSSYYYIRPHNAAIHVSSNCYQSPHTTIHVSSCVQKDLLMHMCGMPGYWEKSVMSAPLSSLESSMASTWR